MQRFTDCRNLLRSTRCRGSQTAGSCSDPHDAEVHRLHDPALIHMMQRFTCCRILLRSTRCRGSQTAGTCSDPHDAEVHRLQDPASIQSICYYSISKPCAS
ncbi:hypothetical protein AOXY_G37333 [Acipenser oxyrinchus oxyrinchus]|uniref:Uncharacterized protein n=1 Tax=Acipenser oxyrinchus oxyrinchus TaxID=40147 RepID=A0AAD8FQK9_ACIOX|nr:hypothetical protein AOXY_G37333 [Acipenser oxyrinchus oxyrinchus]